MGELIIKINWPWFLGVIGALIVLAWKANGRFTKIETSIDWIKKGFDEVKTEVKDLRVDLENNKLRAFHSGSPISLTENGNKLLRDSGMKDYIDRNKTTLLNDCNARSFTNAYELQEGAFNFFDKLEFDKEFDDRVKRFAFEHGAGMDIIRRVGAIYFRDLCLSELHFDIRDLDRQSSHT